MYHIFSTAKRNFLDVLFPMVCFGCGTEGGFLCAECENKIRFIPPSCIGCGAFVPGIGPVSPGRTCSRCRSRSAIYAFFSPLSFQDATVREMLHGLKYARIRDLGEVCARIIMRYIRTQRVLFPKGVLIVPIPLHRSRERTRGFNQSLLLATGIGKELGIPVFSDVLLRSRKTPPQTGLDATSRKSNVLEAFMVLGEERIQGKTLLLVDDVKTTGATLEEAARTLKRAGAKRIWAITIAH